MKIIAGIFLLSFVFPLEEQDEIGFKYGVLGKIKSKNTTMSFPKLDKV